MAQIATHWPPDQTSVIEASPPAFGCTQAATSLCIGGQQMAGASLLWRGGHVKGAAACSLCRRQQLVQAVSRPCCSGPQPLCKCSAPASVFQSVRRSTHVGQMRSPPSLIMQRCVLQDVCPQLAYRHDHRCDLVKGLLIAFLCRHSDHSNRQRRPSKAAIPQLNATPGTLQTCRRWAFWAAGSWARCSPPLR